MGHLSPGGHLPGGEGLPTCTPDAEWGRTFELDAYEPVLGGYKEPLWVTDVLGVSQAWNFWSCPQ